MVRTLIRRRQTGSVGVELPRADLDRLEAGSATTTYIALQVIAHHRLVEGLTRGMARFAEYVVLGVHNSCEGAHQNTAFAGEVAVDLIFEGGGEQVAAPHADAEGDRALAGATRDVLVDGDRSELLLSMHHLWCDAGSFEIVEQPRQLVGRHPRARRQADGWKPSRPCLIEPVEGGRDPALGRFEILFAFPGEVLSSDDVGPDGFLSALDKAWKTLLAVNKADYLGRVTLPK